MLPCMQAPRHRTGPKPRTARQNHRPALRMTVSRRAVLCAALAMYFAVLGTPVLVVAMVVGTVKVPLPGVPPSTNHSAADTWGRTQGLVGGVGGACSPRRLERALQGAP